MNAHTETAIARAAPASTSNPKKRISAATVCEICGGVSAMTLWRWLNDPEKRFPKPIYIGRRRYWREADVIAWLDAQEGEGAA